MTAILLTNMDIIIFFQTFPTLGYYQNFVILRSKIKIIPNLKGVNYNLVNSLFLETLSPSQDLFFFLRTSQGHYCTHQKKKKKKVKVISDRHSTNFILS